MCPLPSRETGAAAAVQTRTEREDRVGREPQEPEGNCGASPGVPRGQPDDCQFMVLGCAGGSAQDPTPAEKLREGAHSPGPRDSRACRPAGQRGPLGFSGLCAAGGPTPGHSGAAPPAAAPLQAPGVGAMPRGLPHLSGALLLTLGRQVSQHSLVVSSFPPNKYISKC